MEFGTTKPWIYFNKTILEQHELPTMPKCISRCWCHVVSKTPLQKADHIRRRKKTWHTYLVPWAILLGVSRLTSLNQHISCLVFDVITMTSQPGFPKITLEPPTWKGWLEGVVPPSSSQTKCWSASFQEKHHKAIHKLKSSCEIFCEDKSVYI